MEPEFFERKEEKTKICHCCKQARPISDFGTYGGKTHRVCNECLRQKSGASEKFSQYTTRELLDELKARGWRGQLRCIRTETINL